LLALLPLGAGAAAGDAAGDGAGDGAGGAAAGAGSAGGAGGAVAALAVVFGAAVACGAPASPPCAWLAEARAHTPVSARSAPSFGERRRDIGPRDRTSEGDRQTS